MTAGRRERSRPADATRVSSAVATGQEVERRRAVRALLRSPLLRGLRERLADDLDTPGAIALVDAWAEATLAGRDDAEEESPRIVCDAVDALLGIALGDCG